MMIADHFRIVDIPSREVAVKKIAFTLVVAGSIALGGCNKKAEGQVVAVVNGQEITEQQLNAEMQAAHVPDNVDKKRITQEILKRMVERAVLVQKAQSDGVDKSPEYVSQLQAAKDGIAVRIYAERLKKGLKDPDAATVNAYIAKNPNMFAGRKIFELDQIAFPISTSKAIIQQLSGIHSMDALAALLQSKNVQFSRQKGGLDTLTVKPEFITQISGLPAGEPFVVPDQGRFVANTIIGSRAAPIPSDKSHDLAVEMLQRERLDKLIVDTQKAASAVAKITYREGMAPILLDK